MQVENPREVDSVDPELFFQGDHQGRWCIMWGKQRQAEVLNSETVAEYPNFIKHIHHLLMGTAKEMYRVFRITRKVNQGTRMIIDPYITV